MNRRLVFAVLLMLTVFWSSVARASPVTYYFAGTFDFAYAPYAGYLNTAFTGQLVYDPAWPLISSSTSTATYAMPAGALTLWLIDGTAATTAEATAWVDSYPSIAFAGPVSFTATSGSPPSPSWLLLTLLYGQGGPTTALPASLGELSSWGNEFIHYGTRAYGTGAEGWLDCLSTEPGVCGGTSVPDSASSLLLLGIGLVGLRAWRKRWQ